MPRKKKVTEEQVVVQSKTPKKEFIFAVGRRREAVARVRLYPNGNDEINDEIIVNDKPIEQYFPLLSHKVLYQRPFEVTSTKGKFTVTVKVRGGGMMGQLEAVVHGISRVLDKYNREEFRPLLRKHGLLTRDARARQRRMVGMGGKARRKKQSPKR